MVNIDNTDREILDALRRNARISFAQLGRQVGLTAPAVSNRMQRLETLRVIVGYQAHVDDKVLNNHITILIRLSVEHGLEKRFTEFVHKCQEVRKCYRLAGEENFLIKVAVPSTQILERLLAQLGFYGRPITSLILTEGCISTCEQA